VLPALAYHFGIRWGDIMEMPQGELSAYLKALNEIQEASRG